MVSRKEKMKPNQREIHLKLKILIGVLFLSLMVGSSIGVAFADSDINGLMTNWFNKKSNESIDSIEQAIMTEKETQKQRLKEELQRELVSSQKKLDEFTEEEKNKRVEAIKDYADKLIADMQIDNSNQELEVQKQLDSIVENSMDEMEELGNKETKDESMENDSTKSESGTSPIEPTGEEGE